MSSLRVIFGSRANFGIARSGVLDLPPCNSFCRLLAHRLGDYYQLSHFVDNSVSAVRLHKNTNTHL